ncbi:MAG: hypothetical protein Q9184_002542 [Pyrenodesmia sp. 2 TL-2023]
MAPQKSIEAAKQVIAVAKDATTRLFPEWRQTVDDIRSEIRAQGLSANPDDLLTLLSNAEAQDEYYTKLQQWLQEDMSIEDPVAADLIAGYKDLVAEKEELKAQVNLTTPEARMVNEQLRALMQERPREVMSCFHWVYEGKFREATERDIRDLREKIDGVIEKIKPQRDKILATLREELKLEDFTKKFEVYCSMAMVRADMVQEKHDALSVRFQQLKAALKERESVVKTLLAQPPAADTTGLQARIDGLLSELQGKKEAQSGLNDVIALQKEVLVERKAAIDRLENENKSLKEAQEKSTKAIQDKDEAFGQLQAQLLEARTIISNKENELGEKQEQLAEAQSILSNKENELDEKTEQLVQAQSTLVNKGNELDELQKQLHRAQATISNKEDELVEKREQLIEAQATISNKEDELVENREQLVEAQATISNKEDELVEKREQLDKISKAKSDLETRSRELENNVEQKDVEISRLTSAEKAANDALAREDTEKDREISRLREAQKTAEETLARQDTEKDLEISRLKEALQGRIDDLAQKDQEIGELKSSLDTAENQTQDKERDRLLLESALATARDAITRKDAEIADLRSSGQTASEEKAKLVGQVAEKDRVIEGLNDAAHQHRTEISDLEEKIKRSEQTATAVHNEHVNAVREKDERIDDLAAAAQNQQRNITNLEEEVEQVSKNMEQIIQSSGFNPETEKDCIQLRSKRFGRYDSAAIEVTETNALLPSLRFSSADNTRPLMVHILCLCFRLLPGLAVTDVSRHAQPMFDGASGLSSMVPWIRHILFRIGDLLESGNGSIDMARLCLIALQGVVLLDSPTYLGTDPEKINKLVDRVRNWIQNNTTSTCLRFMMGQLEARLARLSPNGALPWLSGYPSGTHHLDATNSTLPAGTHLIADESGLFFLVEPDAVFVFTADDVGGVTWEMGAPRDPLTLHFAADSVLGPRSLVISLDESSGLWVALNERVRSSRRKYGTIKGSEAENHMEQLKALEQKNRMGQLKALKQKNRKEQLKALKQKNTKR